MCENSQSVACASEHGAIHVFRVENGENVGNRTDAMQYSTVEKVHTEEGAVLSLAHYNTSSSSMLLYSTQRGHVHAWDLRSCSLAFHLPRSPEVGLLGTMLIDPAQNWLLVGTSLGFMQLWDLRYQVLVKSYRHPIRSSIE